MTHDELIFPASRAKSLLLLLGCSAFVALGWFLVDREPLIAWLTIGFFGLGIPIALLTLVTNRSHLKFTPQGVEMASLFKTHLVPWRDVARFEMSQIQGTRMIAIVYRPEHAGQTALRRVSASIAGMEAAIPNSYAVPLDRLLVHLTDWHARYGR